MIFKVIFLVALIQLLYKSGKPFLCSGIYAGLVFAFSLVFGAGVIGVLITTAISFVLASVYFWLLNEFSDGALHWAILIGGLLIGLV
jgi:hypothetical protein